MTGVQYVYNVLHNNWQEDVDGRQNPVPKPHIFIESQEASHWDPSQGDMITVLDGGKVNYQPQSINWTEERIESPVTIEIRTVHSRQRLLGYRDDNNVAERYGGLSGEVKRILDTKRRGDHEWDIIRTGSFNDLTGDFGYANYRGRYNVQLVSVASQVDP